MHPIVFRLACLALLAGVLALMVQESGKSTSRAKTPEHRVFDTLQTIDNHNLCLLVVVLSVNMDNAYFSISINTLI
jgi:hypothetical protein